MTKAIEAGRASGAVSDKSLERVAVDTIVMKKAIVIRRMRGFTSGCAPAGGLGERGRDRSKPELRAAHGRLAASCAATAADWAPSERAQARQTPPRVVGFGFGNQALHGRE